MVYKVLMLAYVKRFHIHINNSNGNIAVYFLATHIIVFGTATHVTHIDYILHCEILRTPTRLG